MDREIRNGRGTAPIGSTLATDTSELISQQIHCDNHYDTEAFVLCSAYRPFYHAAMPRSSFIVVVILTIDAAYIKMGRC